jgi:hypothetical protein
LAGAVAGALLGFQQTRRYRAFAWAKFERAVSASEGSAIVPALGRNSTVRDFFSLPSCTAASEKALPETPEKIFYDVAAYPGLQGAQDPCFEISAESGDQDLALRAANVYAETAVRLWNEKESGREESALRELEQKTARVREDLSKIGEAISTYRAGNPEAAFLDAPENMRDLQRRLEQDLRAKDEGIAGCLSRKERLESELRRLNAQSGESLEPDPNDPALRPLRAEIASMESTYNEMSARWTEKNPKMIRFSERLDEKRKELDNRIREIRDQNLAAWNGKIEPKAAEIKAAEAELATLESDRGRIQSEIVEESERVKTVESRLPLVRGEIATLEEKEKQAKADLEAIGRVLAEKRAERTTMALPDSLVVYQQAAAAERKGSYGGVVGGAGGAAAGYLCAWILLLLRLNLRRSFIDAKDVETELGHPVLARFPKRG